MSNVLVIGASRGIGLELVRQYAARDWQVHATTRTPAAPGELGEVGPNVCIHELDVRDADHIAQLAAALSDVVLDAVIHNAGVHDRDYSRDEVMEINAVAPFKVLGPLLPSLRRADRPKLVLVTSQLGARRGSTGSLGVYGDSKAALNDRFREVAPAWGEEGITAIVLHPGWVRTDMGGSSAPLSVDESAAGIINLVDSMSGEHHGGFWTWDGRRHPW